MAITTSDHSSVRFAAALVFCVAGILAATGQEPRVIFEEDFERYTNTAAMRAAWLQGAGELELRAPGGGQAAGHSGGDANRRGGFSVLPSPAHNVVMTADLFDFRTNANRLMTVALLNTRGATVEMGVVAGGGNYGARATRFPGGADTWTQFNSAQKPVRGWHRFQAVISLNNTVATLDLDANGKVDWTATLAGSPPTEPWTEIRFGAQPNQISRGGPMLVDNIRIELVPVTQALTTQSAPVAESGNSVAHLGTTPAAGATVGGNAAVWWIMFALAVIISLLAWLVLALRRSGLRASTALQPAGANSPVTHEAAIAELTAFAKQSLVQGLYEQRNALIETQKQAQQALVELEQRLAALHLPQQARIRAYEHRIAELEKELESRGEEVRELTQATLLLVRRKLEEERGLGHRRDQFN